MNASDSYELTELATMLEKKAKLADAKLALAKHRLNADDSAKEAANAEYCRRKAAILHRLAGPKIRNKA